MYDKEHDGGDIKESQEPKEESPYTSFKRMVVSFSTELHNLEQKLINMQSSFDDAQQAYQSGAQNLYNKFIEIEKRQIEIEDLLKSDRIVDFVKKIPTESDIRAMLMKVENTDISKLAKSIDRMRDNLEEIIEKFM